MLPVLPREGISSPCNEAKVVPVMLMFVEASSPRRSRTILVTSPEASVPLFKPAMTTM